MISFSARTEFTRAIFVSLLREITRPMLYFLRHSMVYTLTRTCKSSLKKLGAEERYNLTRGSMCFVTLSNRKSPPQSGREYPDGVTDAIAC
jgi:hypothetical protein